MSDQYTEDQREKASRAVQLTDREMLFFAYGAIRALATDGDSLQDVVQVVEEHLFPPNVSRLTITKTTDNERPAPLPPSGMGIFK